MLSENMKHEAEIITITIKLANPIGSDTLGVV